MSKPISHARVLSPRNGRVRLAEFIRQASHGFVNQNELTRHGPMFLVIKQEARFISAGYEFSDTSASQHNVENCGKISGHKCFVCLPRCCVVESNCRFVRLPTFLRDQPAYPSCVITRLRLEPSRVSSRRCPVEKSPACLYHSLDQNFPSEQNQTAPALEFANAGKTRQCLGSWK